jgi:hypothetical protein
MEIIMFIKKQLEDSLEMLNNANIDMSTQINLNKKKIRQLLRLIDFLESEEKNGKLDSSTSQ